MWPVEFSTRVSGSDKTPVVPDEVDGNRPGGFTPETARAND